jgi:hypothetical protein
VCNRRRITCLLKAAALLCASGVLSWAQHAPAQVAASENKYALLIGIDTYEPPGTKVKIPAGVKPVGRFAAGLEFSNLEGPTHDVDAMRTMLTGERFGFAQKNIDVLLDGAATHDAILARLEKDLVSDRKAGDMVVLYISSHGSLRVNSKSDAQVFDLASTEQAPMPLDSTLVPADAYLGAEDVLSSDLRHIFNLAANKGVKLTAIFDSCHSGGQARGATDKRMVPRNVEYDPRDLATAPAAEPAPADRKDNRVLILSAAQKDQSAMDVQDAHPHGLFTAALILALQELSASAPAIDIYRRVLVDMESGGADNQQPALDATSERKHEPLFGGEVVQGPARAAVVSVDDGIVLDVGPTADVGTGSEFTAVNAVNGVKTMLRVTDAVSLARSHAVVVSPAKAGVKSGDLFELTKWLPAPRPQVKFYAGPGNLTLAQIKIAIEALAESKVMLVNDPSVDAWTHIITWNGSAWTLQAKKPQAAADKPAKLDEQKAPPLELLGPTLNPDALTKILPAKAVVWFNPPLPSEMMAALLSDRDSAAQPTSKPDDALYVLAGVQNAKGLTYAWYKRGDFEGDVQTPSGYGRGCSPNSPYPLRTDWVSAGPDATGALNDAAAKLTKLNGWLKLQSTVSGSTDFPYSLALMRVSDKKTAADGSSTYAGEEYTLALNGSVDAITTPRWVYVLGIDCQGSGELLWPREGPGGRFPTENGRLASIPLPGLTFSISAPYGTDTYILLTTSTPLPDPDVLNFEGAVRGGTRGVANPLEDLLRATSAGSRGATTEVPTDWSLQLVQMHSQPTSAPAHQ